MTQNKINKLELTWIGKEDEPLAIEPRLLLDTPEYSFGEVETGTLPNGKPWPGNMLIHGDNLLALRALEENFVGAVKCIYIDPPYNTGSAFEHYDDNLEHSKWLSLMLPRIQMLNKLLTEDGVMFISIDDDEAHYLKVLCDQVFGRKNYAGTLVWEKKKKPSFLSNMGSITEYVLAYVKNKDISTPFIYGTTTAGKKYPFNNAGNGRSILTFPARYVKFNMPDAIIEPQDMSGGAIYTKLLDTLEIKDGRNVSDFRLEGEWRYSQQRLNEIVENGEEIIISKIPFRPNHVKRGGEPKKMKNLLSVAHYNMSTYEDATLESTALFGKDSFDYPKPEMLISVLIGAVTNPGDLVLDSFVGSGTSVAVAHKMNRRWIGVELGEHAYTHCVTRMKKVIEGEQGGISKSVNWQGGGGFKFYELAPSLLNKDKYGNLVINKDYNADMLAAAMAKHQGFTFSPDAELYWKQGHSSEHDFIYTTTQLITTEMLETIHDQLGEDESLLICCTKFQPECRNKFSNITIKKIPKVLLDTCEFDHNDYSLNIVSVPDIADDDRDDTELEENPLSDSESEQS